MLKECVGLSQILFHIFCTAHRCLAASKHIFCSFLLVWLGLVLLLKSPLFRQRNPRLSAICSTLLCLHIYYYYYYLLFTTILLLTESIPFKATVFILRVGIFNPHLAATVSSLCTEICSASSESDTVTWSSSIKSVLMSFVSWKRNPMRKTATK